ncbi:hypothetical protein BV22DRAFT_999907 [Leucogyrophana mollusca]|uniref:Uncharacterized protein n=1 Tax=Leucogyrophana mollusca TaxID=85980 RepID=A0ACB8C068_9AGAM|nr:hypothetical protein BV22DRAFT_999907 [Leucogyrophana mollusca]
MSYPPPRSPSPPTITHHPAGLLGSFPIPNIAQSAAGGAHYSGAPMTEAAQPRSSSGNTLCLEDDKAHLNRQQIMRDLKELYCCRPTREIFERTWRRDAVFEDPLTKCQGFDQYAPQWFAMPKLFSKSETISSRIMASTQSPNRLVYSQTQEYTLRYIGSKKRIESIILVDLDEDDKIMRMADQWGGNTPPAWFGANFLRRANARVTPWFMRLPKQ